MTSSLFLDVGRAGSVPARLGLKAAASARPELRGLWLFQIPGQAKAIIHGLALAWPGPGHGFHME